MPSTPDSGRNDSVLSYEQLESDPIADIDGDGIEIIEFARKPVKPERRVRGIELKQAKRFFIVAE